MVFILFTFSLALASDPVEGLTNTTWTLTGGGAIPVSSSTTIVDIHPDVPSNASVIGSLIGYGGPSPMFPDGYTESVTTMTDTNDLPMSVNEDQHYAVRTDGVTAAANSWSGTEIEAYSFGSWATRVLTSYSYEYKFTWPNPAEEELD
jgi:hypothetical protein